MYEYMAFRQQIDECIKIFYCVMTARRPYSMVLLYETFHSYRPTSWLNRYCYNHYCFYRHATRVLMRIPCACEQLATTGDAFGVVSDGRRGSRCRNVLRSVTYLVDFSMTYALMSRTKIDILKLVWRKHFFFFFFTHFE